MKVVLIIVAALIAVVLVVGISILFAIFGAAIQASIENTDTLDEE